MSVKIQAHNHVGEEYMKIGEFAIKCGVSKDTVRFYMKNGLLIPGGMGAQYSFTEREFQDMQTILKMKEQHFTLQEIHRFLDIKRVSTMLEPESIQEAVTLLNGKRLELERQIQSLQGICTGISRDIQKFSCDEEIPGEHTGVPVRSMPLLVCPHCGSALELENASLSSRYIYNGLLHCRCGYRADIDNGIIKTGNLYTAPYDVPDLQRKLYRNVNEDFVTYLQKCSDFTLNTLRSLGLKRKVVLEGHINSYFFLYNNFRYLENDCLYIMVDKYPEMLRMYKRLIDQLNLGLDILYIADATMDWPLRHGSVDVMVDFIGDEEHSLYFKSFYVRDVKPFLTDDAHIIGAAEGYHNGAKSLVNLARQYPEGDIAGFLWDELERMYAEAGFARKGQLVGTMRNVVKHRAYGCHHDGEEMMIGYFHAVPLHKETGSADYR